MNNHPVNGNGGYEVIYGVGLLDDLHNYFPALLYDQGRFQNVSNVFHYIRTQMSNRFNLFAFGANRWRQAEREQEEELETPIFTFTPPPTINGAPRTTNPIVMEETIAVDTNLAATTLLLSLLGGGLQRTTPAPITATTTNTNAVNRWANFLQPIVRRPSTADLSRNTELVTGLTDTSCAVCQELIRNDDMARRLRPCRHVYHQACIDTWFERSVFCPTCRHDIREPPAQ